MEESEDWSSVSSDYFNMNKQKNQDDKNKLDLIKIREILRSHYGEAEAHRIILQIKVLIKRQMDEETPE